MGGAPTGGAGVGFGDRGLDRPDEVGRPRVPERDESRARSSDRGRWRGCRRERRRGLGAGDGRRPDLIRHDIEDGAPRRHGRHGEHERGCGRDPDDGDADGMEPATARRREMLARHRRSVPQPDVWVQPAHPWGPGRSRYDGARRAPVAQWTRASVFGTECRGRIPPGAPSPSLLVPASARAQAFEHRLHGVQRRRRRWPEHDLQLSEADGAEAGESLGDLRRRAADRHAEVMFLGPRDGGRLDDDAGGRRPIVAGSRPTSTQVATRASSSGANAATSLRSWANQLQMSACLAATRSILAPFAPIMIGIRPGRGPTGSCSRS